MSYKDAIECPHCHQTVDLEIEIENDVGYMNLCPIVIPKKGVVDCPITDKDSSRRFILKETHWDELELERRLGK